LFGAFLDPGLLAGVAPDARFERIAHLPAHRLAFSAAGSPLVVPDEAHTVWGGVFRVSVAELAALTDAHAGDTEAAISAWAVDREGDRFEVVVFSGPDGSGAAEDQLGHMVRGARHWELPAGWVVGLEDLLNPFEF
jgi:gamma-glutamylcyclotransferase (GGCT)/AIG2-like uncharacterized protein YtfP